MGSGGSAERGGDSKSDTGTKSSKGNELTSTKSAFVSQAFDMYNPDDPSEAKPLSLHQLRTMMPEETEFVHEKIKKDLELTKVSRDAAWIEEEINKAINIDYMYKKYFSRKALSRFSIQNDQLKIKFLISDLESWKNVPRFARYLLFAVKPPCGFGTQQQSDNFCFLNIFSNLIVCVIIALFQFII